ncbi:MAG TPA: peptidylprolyl isomerase [Planctomycetota bacterium]|nr:peptidylprolyl isomerase [Planctomycetota bacterium]
MNAVLRLVLAAAAAAPIVPAQGFEVRLEPAARVVPSGSDIRLTLTVDVRADAEVPATLLSGLQLESKVGDSAGPRIEEPKPGTVALTAGTTVRRTLTVPAARLSLPPVTDLVDVTLSWKDIPSATTVVKVAPDVSQIAVEDLDLGKTKVLLLTNYGQMVVRFFPDKAPKHVANFVKLAKERFYDGTRFHRVVKGFMLQGGCPNTKEGATGIPGTGNPGYTLKAEFNDVKHERGVLSMARSSHPDSAGSQFFIMHGKAPHLDGQYSAFGILESGFDTLDRIAEVRVRPNESGEPSMPVEPVHLHAAIVLPVLKGK